MKNKSLPAMLVVSVLLFILTGLTIVFVADYFSAYGRFSDNGSLYDTRSPIYSTKSMDTEAVQYSRERAEALQEFNVVSSDDATVFDYGLSRYSRPDAAKPAANGDARPIRDDRTNTDGGVEADNRATADSGADSDNRAEANTDILYMVYSESAAESGGY